MEVLVTFLAHESDLGNLSCSVSTDVILENALHFLTVKYPTSITYHKKMCVCELCFTFTRLCYQFVSILVHTMSLKNT